MILRGGWPGRSSSIHFSHRTVMSSGEVSSTGLFSQECLRAFSQHMDLIKEYTMDISFLPTLQLIERCRA
jgi:hypothetical protein